MSRKIEIGSLGKIIPVFITNFENSSISLSTPLLSSSLLMSMKKANDTIYLVGLIWQCCSNERDE